jgi:GTP-binding protein HflX
MKKVIVVQRVDPDSDDLKNKRQLAELKDLAFAANYSVTGEVIQSRYPDKKYQLGKGKVQELALSVKALDAEKVIFCNELSSMQLYNITDTCKCAVIDKFQLILEIFALRATTRRAKLQVELARLEYEIPRAKIIVSHLKKEERPGFMGLGSYEDSYEQDIKGRIARIKGELSHVQGTTNPCALSGTLMVCLWWLLQAILMPEKVRCSMLLWRRMWTWLICFSRLSLRLPAPWMLWGAR